MRLFSPTDPRPPCAAPAVQDLFAPLRFPRLATPPPFFSKMFAVLPAALLARPAEADYAWNFPTPATPIAGDTLHIHNQFMLIITALFVVVFAIMIYSMIRHRKRSQHAPAKFSGPTGKLQWFWMLVPFAILLYIDFVLMGIPAFHAVVAMEDTKTKADMVLKVTGRQDHSRQPR